ncbi:YceI family protein [Rubritalea tangerina]|uniref:YceI family protein n=1 Tax=Rubritalea tangerina TaxID=430798 RepID=A0ABW4ZBT6_9BACT
MPSNKITPDELNALMASVDSLLVIDVRLDDDFAYQHIPKSLNNAVFEMAFAERMAQIAPNPRTPICVYGSQEGSLESAEAAAKLVRLGYERVYDLHGGIDAWAHSGHAIVNGDGSPPTPPKLSDGVYQVDLDNSHLKWIGRNLLNSHHGSIAITSGKIEIQSGSLVDAQLEVDFTKITCDDLQGSEWHDVLIAHLESDDFFDTEHFPAGGFRLTDSETLADLNSGALNLKLEGDLVMRGQVHPVTLSASAGISPDGQPALQAHFSIDRTHWGMRYGSGKFFSRLAGHLVNDQIELELKIIGKSDTTLA